MKFEDILLKLLLEQVEPPEEDDVLDVPDEDPENDPNDDGEEPEDNETDVNAEPIEKKVKPLKPMEVLVNKWKAESPGIDDNEIRDAIEFFRTRRGSLRPYMDPEEAIEKDYRNSPEVVELKRNFPTFPAESVVRLRDIQNYSWDQLEFLIDRFNGTANLALVDFRVEGDTPEIRKANSLKKWERTSNRIIDKNGVIVFRVTGQDESIALGDMQHILTSTYGGVPWCITNIGSSYYKSYRNRRSYYFIMDTTKPENSPERMSVIQPINHNDDHWWRREGPFVISKRPNSGDFTNETWQDIVNIWPALEGEAEKFQYFGETRKEAEGARIGDINFNGDPANNPWDFEGRNVTKELKLNFVTGANNIIPKFRYFQSLGTSLLHSYIQSTTKDTYHLKFVSDNRSRPYEILDHIQKFAPQEYKYLDSEVLKRLLGIPMGVGAIKLKMMCVSYEYSFTELGRNIKLLQDKNTELFGIISLNTLEFIKPIDYIYTSAKSLVKTVRNENGKLKDATSYLFRYSLSHTQGGDDYFYWFTPFINIMDQSKNKPNYYKGTFLDKEQGDQLLTSKEYVVLPGKRTK